MDQKVLSEEVNATLSAAMTPWLGIMQMQQDLLKMHLAAGAEFSRRSLQLMESPGTRAPASAPMQVMEFAQDWMKLSLAPLTLATASSLQPFRGSLAAAGAGSAAAPAVKLPVVPAVAKDKTSAN